MGTAVASDVLLDGGETEIAATHVEGGDRAMPLLVCVPGGGYTRRYFDICRASFLDRVQANGFAALALDRPGYGDSAMPLVEDGWFDAQTTALDAAITDAWARFGAQRPGVVVIAHSFGATIGLRLAARYGSGQSTASWPLRGLAINGTLDAVVPSMQEFAAALHDVPAQALIPLTPQQVRGFFYGPDGSFEAKVLGAAAASVAPAPAVEIREWAAEWPAVASTILGEITAPLQIRVAENDALVDVTPAALARFAGHFERAAAIDMAITPGAGHNSDHHRSGRALHLEQLAFAARCSI
jgi:pimeloyl-ACP methyl ester carboxylesterase